jgi:hypothetical protein
MAEATAGPQSPGASIAPIDAVSHHAAVLKQKEAYDCKSFPFLMLSELFQDIRKRAK